MKIGDKVNAVNCAQAGHPDYVGMVIVSEPWKLGHGETVMRVERPSGKVSTWSTQQMVVVSESTALETKP